MHLDLKTFLVTGEFGSITFGMTRQALADVLGKPDKWGRQSDPAKAEIWCYGSLEFYFPKHSDGLYMIYSDWLDPLKGSQNLTLDPWVLSGQLRLQEAEATFTQEGIVYKRIDQPQLDAVDLVMESRVVVRFDFDEEAEEYRLGGFWLKTSQPEFQRHPTRQVSVTLPLHIYEKLRRESLVRRKSITRLCSEWLINFASQIDG
jgi:hypothetical protein